VRTDGVTEQTPILKTKFWTDSSPLRRGPADSVGLLFRIAWYSINFLLIVAVTLVACSVAWEYSTRAYLKGFSDAVVPESASGEAKVEAILRWFSYGPARQDTDDTSLLPDRDPTQTLNYTKLLRNCGTATNAFVNLADSGGMKARRLLLLDPRELTKHVVAEVLVDGRWIIVDPSFHRILRGADGMTLTREQLADPMVWSAATGDIPGYDASYTYDDTAHVRLARLSWAGRPLRAILDRLAPGWEDSWALSLLLERESLAVLVGSIILVLLLYGARLALRRYGEKRLNIRTIRLTDQVKRAVILSFSRPPESGSDNAAPAAHGPQAPPTEPASAPTSTTI
jgi:hypothetical protein